MRRRFFTLDVFTAKRFTGNPLAVVLEPQSLDTAAMQTIAREFGHPETVFVFPAEQAGHRAKLRIFTPARELPFAGHPTVGTAVLLARLDGGTQARDMILDEGVGPVACMVKPDADGGNATFQVPRIPERIGVLGDRDAIAAALSLRPADIDDSSAMERWSAGNSFSFVPLRGLDAMRRARPDLARWDQAFGADGIGAFLFCRETAEPGHAIHARMFAPSHGVPEDPATGSAAAAFAGLIAVADKLGDGAHNLVIEQGYEMGRPSLLRLSLTIRQGALTTASIGGDAVVVTEGAIEA
jgi:trans-2,3-dihydro-3-hydroxyanthranilate isomerase